MEEILASIRRIISEDDAPPPAAPAPEPEPAAFAAEPEPEPVALADDGVLELTDRVESVGDLDIYDAEPAPPAPEPEPEPEPVFVAPPPEPAPPPPSPAPTPAPAPVLAAAAPISGLAGSTTIEELVRAILEPQIKAWAEANLSTIVDGVVREQIQAKLGQVFK